MENAQGIAWRGLPVLGKSVSVRVKYSGLVGRPDRRGMKDTIDISQRTADALTCLGIWDIYTVNEPEIMAAMYFILKNAPDDPRLFPHGKWATIQNIEAQLVEWAKDKLKSL